jgi:methylmalonyl-CoA epimerase
MAIKRVDHIAIVVEKLDAALGVYRDALGMAVSDILVMPEQDVKMAMLPTGDSEIELLEPLSAESGIGRYLAKRGEGLHHICLEVDDIEATLADLKARGAQLIDETPKQGANGRIAFIHPKGSHGVLIELVEREASRPA